MLSLTRPLPWPVQLMEMDKGKPTGKIIPGFLGWYFSFSRGTWVSPEDMLVIEQAGQQATALAKQKPRLPFALGLPHDRGGLERGAYIWGLSPLLVLRALFKAIRDT